MIKYSVSVDVTICDQSEIFFLEVEADTSHEAYSKAHTCVFDSLDARIETKPLLIERNKYSTEVDVCLCGNFEKCYLDVEATSQEEAYNKIKKCIGNTLEARVEKNPVEV